MSHGKDDEAYLHAGKKKDQTSLHEKKKCIKDAKRKNQNCGSRDYGKERNGTGNYNEMASATLHCVFTTTL